jgi:hypothetical protein
MAFPQESKGDYQQRLEKFIADMERVSRLHPREEYLYPILDTPVFSDLQTALMMAELNHRSGEKNK